MMKLDDFARLRVFVLTDIENEPDDAMSLVRFLTYSNQWDVEGLIATTSIHLKDKTAAWRIREILNAYGQVRNNLLKHEPGFPSVEYLLSVVGEGLPLYGMEAVGEEMDSQGSHMLMKSIEKDDDRPLWILVWGGTNVLAQALFKLSRKNSEDYMKKALSKLRVYAISDQDDSAPWIRSNFKDLFYIVSPGFSNGGAYHYATWSGISGDHFHGRFSGSDFSIVDNPWLEENIIQKGSLGAVYPRAKYLMEGDTPTFLYLIQNGLGNPEHPNWGSWGGRYELYLPPTKKWFLTPETRPIYSDTEDEVLGVDGQWYTSNKATIWRWRKAFQHDFAARMDWTIKTYEKANHPPIVKINHPDYIEAKPGDIIHLDATGSFDPDGDELSYHWFCYNEAGSFAISLAKTAVAIDIQNHNQIKAWFEVPTKRVLRNGTIHIILEVTDDGIPALTRYKRIIINVSDQ